MNIKVNLRKLSAINKDLIGIITKNRNTFKQTVRLNAFQVEAKVDTFNKALAERNKKIEDTFTLQTILSRFRRVVAEANAELGINNVLQELRETEDRLAILQSTVVASTDIPEYNGYNDLEEAVVQLHHFETAEDAASRLSSRGLSKAEVRFVTDKALDVEINTLQRKIKSIKDDKLVALNFKDIFVELTEIEKELLESLNVL